MKRSILPILFLIFAFEGFAQDIGVSDINSPSTGCNLGINSVSVDLTNYGATQTLLTFNIRYQLDGGSVVSQSQVLTNFSANSTQTVTFTVPINLTSNYGSHTLIAYTDLTADTDRSNDTTSKVVINYQPTDGGLLSADDTVCQTSNGDTLFLTDNVGAVQQWESNNGAGYMPIVTTDSFLVYSNLSTTTMYRVLVKNGDCSSDYSNVATITVDTPAEAGSLAASKIICFGDPGDTLRLTSYNGNIAYWQKNEGSGWIDVANTDDTLIYSSLATTTRFRAVVERGACDADTSNEVTITVLPKSEGGTITPSSSNVCAYNNSGTLTLQNKIGNVLRWELSDDNGGTWIPFVKTDTFHTFTNLAATRQFRALVQFQNCDAVYSSVAVVNVEAAANAGTLQEDKQVCAGSMGDTLRLVNYDGTIVKWQINSGSTWTDIANSTDTLVYPAPTSNSQYRVVVSKGSCPNDTSNVVSVSVVSDTKGGKIVPKTSLGCENDNSGVLKLSNKQGNVTRWEISDDNGSTWVPVVNSSDSQQYNNLASSRLYRVLVEATGCPAKYSDTAEVQIFAKPVGGEVLEDKSICGGTNLDTLTLVNYEGTVTKWQSNNGSGWNDINNTTDTLIVSSIFQTTSYRAIVGNSICPNDTSDQATLTIISNTYGGMIQKDDSVCKDINAGTLVLQGHIGDIRWWEFSTDNGVNWNLLANEDTTQGYLNLNKTTWYRVLVEGTNCPNDYSDTAVLTTYTPPLKITPSDTTSFCLGGEVDLEATAGYSSYSWSTGETSSSITATTDDSYKVTITDKRGCTNSDSIKVTVFELPIADAGEDVTISLGATIQLFGSGGEYYNWSPGESLSDSLAASPFANPIATTTYELVVTDENGCTGSDQVIVTVNKDYNFNGKNLITPNGDGVNDTWKVDNILPYKECTVTIINRFGAVVFEKTGYDNSWDGTDGDKVVSDGTYYFIITCEGTNEVFKGNITLLTK